MRYHERGGKNLKAKNTVLRGVFQVTSEEGVFTSMLESFVDFF
jgi:hypothetical protein